MSGGLLTLAVFPWGLYLCRPNSFHAVWEARIISAFQLVGVLYFFHRHI